jgi:hypothetical protein
MTRVETEQRLAEFTKRILSKARLSKQMSQKLRVSLQSEGEGEEVLKLRQRASKSLMPQH